MKVREVEGKNEIEVLLQKRKTTAVTRRQMDGRIVAVSSEKEKGVGKGSRRIFHVHMKGVERVTRGQSIYIAIS